MGGPGSGYTYRIAMRKHTVEESLTLTMRDIRKRLFAGAAGSLTWTWRNGGSSSINYFVTWNEDAPAVTLSYRWGDTEDVRVRVPLQTTPTQFGGSRWWFTCPLVVRGVACNRRAGKLYLPPGAKYFGCRVCHVLTYRSAQEAHQTERVLGRLGLDAQSARQLASRLGKGGG